SLPSPLEAAMASGHISALEALRSGGEGRVRGSFRVLKSFIFPRQSGGERLCLADFVRPMCLPPSAPPLRRSAAPPFHCDYLALFVVTCGEGILQESERLRESGDYFKSHALAALAIECAEASAELLHEKLRGLWGFADPPAMTLLEKFQAKYRGKRYSFGYPACPNLEDQKKLFELLEPEKHIGVKLTENFMMDPEASVSALVFHHPQAKYFSAAPAA
ncbi:MAG: hypothetical protein HY747_05305, partial [Elusimicrobia bacterium]|nr:hypothetical protein [Elusimicrobiota bacterium]